MDSDRWPSLSSGQSDRKRTFGQMQSPSSHHNSHQQGTSFPQFLPHPHRSSFFNNNNSSPITDHFLGINNNFNNMADRARNRTGGGRSAPYPPPRLQHRTSQTVIDLTGDSDEASPPRARTRDHRPSNRRPPRLGRDILGEDDFIDLTTHSSEAEPDLVEVLSRRPVNPPQPERHQHRHRPQYDHRRPVNLAPPRRIPDPPNADILLALGGHNEPGHGVSFFRRAMAHIPGSSAGLMGLNAFMGRGPAGGLNVAAMNGMNYDAIAFGSPGQASPQKTPHVPPKPARPGFTRSPAALEKDQILICPACEEELVHHENENPPPTTNAKGKALTDKERAEHPFWVVRKCGHVFCNKCYQNRKIKTGDSESKFFLPNQPKSEKTLICVVEDCNSSVAKPADWIGIFL